MFKHIVLYSLSRSSIDKSDQISRWRRNLEKYSNFTIFKVQKQFDFTDARSYENI